jgi:hypothetical protein
MSGLGGWRGALATVAIVTCAIGCDGEEPAEMNTLRHCFDEPHLVADISSHHDHATLEQPTFHSRTTFGDAQKPWVVSFGAHAWPIRHDIGAKRTLCVAPL